MKTLSEDRYTYRITWSENDAEYVGLCAEFKSLSWLDETPERALSGIRALVEEVVEDLKASGETVPQPMASRNYSGKILVRVPPDVHRQISIKAAEQGVSLNRYISSQLSG